MLSKIEDALDDVKSGKPVIIVDSPDRENECDVFVAAEIISEQQIRFMRTQATGLICVSLLPERLDYLEIKLQDNKTKENKNSCRMCVGVDYKGIRDHGMSDYDRVFTIHALVDKRSNVSDFIPGHVFPLRAEPNGVLEREGHTEASMDLARLAGLYKGGVICEIVNQNGTMARLNDITKKFGLAREYGLKIVSIEDLRIYRVYNNL